MHCMALRILQNVVKTLQKEVCYYQISAEHGLHKVYSIEESGRNKRR